MKAPLAQPCALPRHPWRRVRQAALWQWRTGLRLLTDPDALIVCNGYKDEAYVETALLAQKLGRKPILVIDRFSDIDIILKVARRHDIRPHLGVRAKLSTPGAGRWAESGGSRSKFGLSSSEIVEAVTKLREAGMLDCLELLHFHMGSQVPAIRILKSALAEASLPRSRCSNTPISVAGVSSVTFRPSSGSVSARSAIAARTRSASSGAVVIDSLNASAASSCAAAAARLATARW